MFLRNLNKLKALGKAPNNKIFEISCLLNSWFGLALNDISNDDLKSHLKLYTITNFH